MKRAMLWKGTANSSVDLSGLLPVNFVNTTANLIDWQGNIYGLATSGNEMYAVEWLKVVPEPASLLLIPLIAAAIARRPTR